MGLINKSFIAVLLLLMATTPTLGDDPIRVLAFGDSLTAGYGLATPKGFTAKLEAELRARGHEVTVINAGVSGDTSAGGRARLDWSLSDNPDAVILELGANDGLRGLDPAETKANLNAILSRLAEAGLPVLLTGMKAPPNLGRDYGAAFNAMYPDLAEVHKVLLYPFFLDGVAGDLSLNQDDGIHPNEAGVDRIVERMAPMVETLIAKTRR